MKSRGARWRQCAVAVRALDPTMICRAAAVCDGHSILKPEALTDAGLPVGVVQHLIATHRSDGSPKGTLFVAGQPVDELHGVYGLHALRFLADALGVAYPSRFGRGSQARAIRKALHDHFALTGSADPS